DDGPYEPGEAPAAPQFAPGGPDREAVLLRPAQRRHMDRQAGDDHGFAPHRPDGDRQARSVRRRIHFVTRHAASLGRIQEMRAGLIQMSLKGETGWSTDRL